MPVSTEFTSEGSTITKLRNAAVVHTEKVVEYALLHIAYKDSRHILGQSAPSVDCTAKVLEHAQAAVTLREIALLLEE